MGFDVLGKREISIIAFNGWESCCPCSAAIQTKDHPSIHFSVHLSVHPFISLSCPTIYQSIIRPCIYVSIHLRINLLSFYPFIHLPSHLIYPHISASFISYSSIYLSKCIHIHLSSPLCIHAFIYPFTHLYIHPPIYTSIHLSIYLSVHQFIHTPIHLSNYVPTPLPP